MPMSIPSTFATVMYMPYTVSFHLNVVVSSLFSCLAMISSFYLLPSLIVFLPSEEV